MYHLIFEENTSYDLAILNKLTAFSKKGIEDSYYKPLVNLGVSSNKAIAFSLDADAKTAKPQRAYLSTLLPSLDKLGIKHLLVNDASYYKTLTGVKDTSCMYGSIVNCAIPGYTHMKIALGMNFQVFIYDPKQKDKLDLTLSALANSITGLHINNVTNFKNKKEFTRDSSYSEIKEALEFLLTKPELAIDVEDFGLTIHETYVGTISFSWDTDSAYVFAVGSAKANEGSAKIVDDPFYHKMVRFLRIFFSNYKGNKVYHNASYDTKVLIFNLFMLRDFFDIKNMIKGIEVLLNNFDDTKLIAYLATNSTARNELSLKILALPFAGNYGLDDIKDITKIPLNELLNYNAIDTVSTLWVKDQYYPVMVADEQLNIYETIFKPSLKDIVQMELVGVPLNFDRVMEVAGILEEDITNLCSILQKNPYVLQLQSHLRLDEYAKCNAEWKTKKEPLSYFDYVIYKPTSNNQNQRLIYETMDLPVIDKTKKGKPSVGGDTLKKLINHTTDKDKIEVLEALLGLAQASIINDNFINSFLTKSIKKSDGYFYLHGNFNLGGTVSGRLSSSDPNMQNMPSSGNKYAKLVKSCIEAPPGWVLIGVDFSSLEDKISALTTKDPNKIKVYTDGYDGHCIRAYSYFGTKMPDIDPNSVDSINSIADKYGDIRQASKEPTFLLTYDGTWHGLVANCGFSPDVAKEIERKYHELYAVSDQWKKTKIAQACIDGHVTVAFGLRVRTPLLAKTILNTKVTPYEAQAESRTAGNALGQSYGLLNNRAAIEFRQRLMASDYLYDVLPIMQIHDAQYTLIREDIRILEWVNTNMVQCTEWQDLPEIRHDIVKLGGELIVFHPTWANEIKIPNNATVPELQVIFDKVNEC